MKKKYVVSVVKCPSYKNLEVRRALILGLKNINFQFKKDSKILIKPNLLSPMSPKKAITTHPVVIEELCKILKEYNCKIYIGESSSMDTDSAFQVCGVSGLKKYAKIINFEKEDKKFFDFGKKIHRIPLPKILFSVDLVINIAKMKTHGLTKVTLCTKNLYGCIPGELKAEIHKILPRPKEFSKLLINLEKIIKPELNIIDGVLGLEGNGPGASGTPINSQLILAGRSAQATDIIASEIMGFDSKKIYTTNFSKIDREEIQAIGNMENLNFKKPSGSPIQNLLLISKLFSKPKITFDKKKCKKCHACEKKCPVQAISLKTKDRFPECNHKKCIHCLCCIEVCPYNAISLQAPFTQNLLIKFAKKIIRF